MQIGHFPRQAVEQLCHVHGDISQRPDPQEHFRLRAILPHRRVHDRSRVPHDPLIGQLEGEAGEQHSEDYLCERPDVSVLS